MSPCENLQPHHEYLGLGSWRQCEDHRECRGRVTIRYRSQFREPVCPFKVGDLVETTQHATVRTSTDDPHGEIWTLPAGSVIQVLRTGFYSPHNGPFKAFWDLDAYSLADKKPITLVLRDGEWKLFSEC